MDKNIAEWMIEQNIANNGIQAGNIFMGLKLAQHDRAEQERLCKLYRSWRPKTDKKNDIPSWQAFQLTIAGIDPADVVLRQIKLSEVSK
jgi:hypothetical protein